MSFIQDVTHAADKKTKIGQEWPNLTKYVSSRTYREVRIIYCLFFKKVPSSASFSFIFGLCKQTMLILQQINVKNVHPV